MTTLIKNVDILALTGERQTTRANILIDGSKIAAVGSNVTAPGPNARVIDGSGLLAVPGLINAHFHSPVNHMKGCLDGYPLEIFMLYESPSLDDLLPSPREAYLRTALAALEMVKLGVTALQDDAFFIPHPTPEIIDAVMQAYADVGIRARVALDQQDVAEIDKLPYLAEILPQELRERLSVPPAVGSSDLLAAYAHLISSWHGACGGRLKAAVSCSAPQRVTEDYFGALDDLSRAHNLPFYTHMLETKTQRVLGREKFGRSLVRYVADLGLLSERMNLIHCIWVDDADLDLVASSGAVVAHNPGCNLRLGSGIMPFRKMRDRNIPICLGTDEMAADDGANVWATAKLTGLIHNLSHPDYEKWPKAQEILECLFTGGARAMHENGRIGAIEPGHEADITLLDLDTLAFTPSNDIHRQLIYCETGSSVRMTIVAGQIVFEGNRVTTVDEQSLRAEARDLFAERRQALRGAASAADVWLPYYRRMHLKASTQDVGINRWVGNAHDQSLDRKI